MPKWKSFQLPRAQADQIVCFDQQLNSDDVKLERFKQQILTLKIQGLGDFFFCFRIMKMKVLDHYDFFCL